MRDRSEQILRLACLVLAALVLAEICHAILRVNPLKGVAVPAVPTLVTNAVVNTNSIAGASHSNSVLPTIAATVGVSTNVAATNSVSGSIVVTMTNHSGIDTNSLHNSGSTGTNVTVKAVVPSVSTPTNLTAVTNPVTTNIVAGVHSTNSAAGTNSMVIHGAMTNASMISGRHHSSRMMGGMMGMAGGSAVALPPLIQARVDQIVNSEIFAPVMHPQPMALLGIAGDTIFLRTDSGQSGLVKVGDSLGNVKLLRIGINRALVEQNGQKKELTIFDGYGSDSLLSTKDESSK
jgi:hypothetical protein